MSNEKRPHNEPWGNLSPEESHIARELGFVDEIASAVVIAAELEDKGWPAKAADALLKELETVIADNPGGEAARALLERGARDPRVASAWCCHRCGAQACHELPSGDFHCSDELGGCGRDVAMREYRWRGPVSAPRDVTISGRIVFRAAMRLKSFMGPTADFNQIAEETNLPKFLWTALREHVEAAVRASEHGWIQLDSNRRITFNEEAIGITVISKHGDDKVYPVIAKPFEVVRRIRIGEKIVATIRDQGGEFSGTTPEIKLRLEHNSQILNHRDVADVLGHLLSMVPIISRGQFTYGVYLQDDKLQLPDFIIPKNDFQVEAVGALTPHLGFVASDADWQAYADFFGFYNPYEWMPVAGLAAIAPFSPILRAAKTISPGIMLLGEPGIGKSSLAEALSTKMWAQHLLSANDMGTEFRLPAFLDAIAALLVVDDAESFKWSEFSGHLKKSMETIRGASRGTGARTKDDFLNLASLVFTANHMPQLSEALLARFLIAEFDQGRSKSPPEVRSRFAATQKRLRVVGPTVARAGLEMCKSSFKEFQRILEEEVLPQIEAVQRSWRDNRRPVVWSVLYLGLRILSTASRGIIRLPPVPEFYATVIEPVERMTRQATMDPLVNLRDFIEVWKSRHVNRSYEEAVQTETAQGEGRIFLTDYWLEPRIPGTWITSALLGEYNAKNQKHVEAIIPDLGRAARLVAKRYTAIRLEDLVDKTGDAKSKKIGGRTVRAVFIPSVDPDQVAQTSLGTNGHGTNGSGPPPGIVRAVLGAQERHERVLELIRAEAKAEEGARRDVVLARAMQEGIEPADFGMSIMALKERGRVFCPRGDTLAPM